MSLTTQAWPDFNCYHDYIVIVNYFGHDNQRRSISILKHLISFKDLFWWRQKFGVFQGTCFHLLLSSGDISTWFFWWLMHNHASMMRTTCDTVHVKEKKVAAVGERDEWVDILSASYKRKRKRKSGEEKP